MKDAIKKRLDERLRRDTRPNFLVQDYWKSKYALHYRILGPQRPSLRAEEERFAGLMVATIEAVCDVYDAEIAELRAEVEALKAAPPAEAEKPRVGRPPKVRD